MKKHEHKIKLNKEKDFCFCQECGKRWTWDKWESIVMCPDTGIFTFTEPIWQTAIPYSTDTAVPDTSNPFTSTTCGANNPDCNR